MATPKSSKRSYSDSDSDTEIEPSSFQNFIVLESLEEKPLSKLNPILVEKTLSGIVKPTSVKKLNNSTILVEVDKKTYVDNFWRPQNQILCTFIPEYIKGCSSQF